jgi:hypothetical protein
MTTKSEASGLFKEEVKRVFNKFKQNVLILQELVKNFTLFSRSVAITLRKFFDGPDNKIKKSISTWFRYWIALRDEFTLVYDGAIVRDCQRDANKDFIYPRKSNFKANLKNYDLVKSSVEGFRRWFLKMGDEVIDSSQLIN